MHIPVFSNLKKKEGKRWSFQLILFAIRIVVGCTSWVFCCEYKGFVNAAPYEGFTTWNLPHHNSSFLVRTKQISFLSSGKQQCKGECPRRQHLFNGTTYANGFWCSPQTVSMLLCFFFSSSIVSCSLLNFFVPSPRGKNCAKICPKVRIDFHLST